MQTLSTARRIANDITNRDYTLFERQEAFDLLFQAGRAKRPMPKEDAAANEAYRLDHYRLANIIWYDAGWDA